MIEPFVVRHYTGEERPSVKGNGFDGLEIGSDREEAERFVAFVNSIRVQALEEAAQICEAEEKELRDNWPTTGGPAIVGVERCIRALRRQ